MIRVVVLIVQKPDALVLLIVENLVIVLEKISTVLARCGIRVLFLEHFHTPQTGLSLNDNCVFKVDVSTDGKERF